MEFKYLSTLKPNNYAVNKFHQIIRLNYPNYYKVHNSRLFPFRMHIIMFSKFYTISISLLHMVQENSLITSILSTKTNFLLQTFQFSICYYIFYLQHSSYTTTCRNGLRQEITIEEFTSLVIDHRAIFDCKINPFH